MFRKNPDSAHTRNMMQYWMLQETFHLRMKIETVVCTILLFSFFLFPIRYSWTTAGVILRIAVVLLIFFGARFFAVTRFAVKHSAVGRQLARFGDFNTVYAEVCAAAQTPLYSNGTEVISEKYIFLMPEVTNVPQTSAFPAPVKLLILSVQELERVSVKPNAPYPDEMNTLLFRTAQTLKDAALSGRLYTMTVHMDVQSAQALAFTITEKIQAQYPASENSQNQESGGFSAFETAGEGTKNKTSARANSYPYRFARTPAARSAARFRANPLKELRAGKMRVFRLIVFLIVFINAGAILLLYFLADNHTLFSLPRDFVQFVRRELIARPDQLLFVLGLLAFYLIPTIAFYLRIRHWYRQFLAEYEKLPQPEQKELLEKLCDNFESRRPVVIYTEHVFCFRNVRSFAFQTLLPYSSVLWIYRTHAAFLLPSSAPGIEQSVDFYHLIIRTADRRKYRIASGDEPLLAKRALDAVVGYGDIQRETYLDLVRERKGR